MSTEGQPGPVVGRRLGYLLKHAERRVEELNAEALAPYGIDARELGILLVIDSHPPGSQQQAAQRLGIDRTSMVARIDTLESKGLLARHPHAADRRLNVVELTDAGRRTVRAAIEASDHAEAALLAPLDPQEAEQFRRMLQTVLMPPGPADRNP